MLLGILQVLLLLLQRALRGSQFLQAVFHLGAHGFQAGLVVFHGAQAVEGIHHIGFVPLQFVFALFGALFRIIRSVTVLPEGLLRLKHQGFLIPGLAFAAAEHFLQLPQAALTFPVFILGALAVFPSGFPAAIKGGKRALCLMHLLGAGHQGASGAGDLFLQLGDFRLVFIPLAGFDGQGFLGVAEHRAQVHQFAVQLGQAFLRPVRPDEKQVQVKDFQLCGQFQVFPCGPRLLLQGFELAVQFLQNVIHPLCVFQCPLELFVRFLLAGLELDDTGGLFKDLPPVLAPAGKNFINTPLADDGIALLADAGVAEKIDDVLQAAGGTVEVIFAFTVAVHPTGDHHLGKVHVQGAVIVFKDEGNLAIAEGLALLGAVENHIGHAGAAQGFGGLLPQHPAHGVADIAFSRAIGPDNAGNPFAKHNFRALRKGLEPIQLQLLQPH